VVIELGGNDGLRGSPGGSGEGQSAENGELAKASGAKVLVVGMRMPPNFGPSYTAQFEAMYAEVAKAVGGGLVPFSLTASAPTSRNFRPTRSIHGCCAAGLLDTVWPALAKLLK
jgi:acyl-CoA thioesterase-1